MKNIKFTFRGDLQAEAVKVAKLIASEVYTIPQAWRLVEKSDFSEEITELGTFYKSM